MKFASTYRAFTLIELLVVISIIAVLAGIALPVFSGVQERAAQTEALANGKQIALALKLYATDNDGRFPSDTLDADLQPSGTEVTDSNTALAQLIPDYIQTESIFAIGKSEWSPSAPDERIDNPLVSTPVNSLEAGENHWAYMLNLTDTSNAAYPLLADGFAVGTTPADPAYTSDQTLPGGVWKGKKAIVIKADTSGSIEKCNDQFKVVRKGVPNTPNLFVSDNANDWMGAANQMVNPLQP